MGSFPRGHFDLPPTTRPSLKRERFQMVDAIRSERTAHFLQRRLEETNLPLTPTTYLPSNLTLSQTISNLSNQ